MRHFFRSITWLTSPRSGEARTAGEWRRRDSARHYIVLCLRCHDADSAVIRDSTAEVRLALRSEHIVAGDDHLLHLLILALRHTKVGDEAVVDELLVIVAPRSAPSVQHLEDETSQQVTLWLPCQRLDQVAHLVVAIPRVTDWGSTGE